MKDEFVYNFIKHSKLKPDVELQPHQKRVVDRINEGHSLLLYHGLGSGKTLSSIAATEDPSKAVDVVVPASLRENYKKEMSQYTTPPRPHRNLMSYEKALSGGLHGGDVLVADEIQRINNSAAARSQNIVRAAPRYKQRLVLSGTPIRNAPYELAPIIRTLAPESHIPLAPKDFNDRFLEEVQINPGLWNRIIHNAAPGIETRAKNVGEIRKAIHGHVDYHMPSREHFPDVTEEIVKVPMSSEQRDVYNVVTNRIGGVLAWKVRHNMPLSKKESENLNTFMNAARIVSNTTKPYGGKETAPKMIKAVSDLKSHLDEKPTHKALVYSNYVEGGVDEYSKLLEKAGVPHHVFIGGISDKVRKSMVEDYNSGRVRALLISGAGSEGIDLKGTRMVQIMEPHWNKARIDQAVGRAVRYKSHAHLPAEERKVHVKYYQSTLPQSSVGKFLGTKPDTSADEYLHALSIKKHSLNKQFLDILKEEGERASSEHQAKKETLPQQSQSPA